MKKLFALILSMAAVTIQAKAQTDTVSVLAIGDVMMHTPQLKYDCKGFLRHIAPKMKAADICVANLEFTLAGEPYTGYPCFSAPDGYAGYLADDCGTDVFLMANNHIQDKWQSGVKRTLGIYRHLRDSLGVQFTGVSEDAEEMDRTYPLIIERKGIKLAIINFTYGNNIEFKSAWPKTNLMDRSAVGAAIDSAKARGADFILAFPHWGQEYVLHHSEEQEKWARFLIGKGVDAIVGAHPHVVQDSTHIDGKPVFYSIGNAVSNMSAENTRLELNVTLKFTVDAESGHKTMLEPELEFIWCALPGNIENNYTTINVKEWLFRRSRWATLSDYENMVETWWRVKQATGIDDGM